MIAEKRRLCCSFFVDGWALVFHRVTSACDGKLENMSSICCMLDGEKPSVQQTNIDTITGTVPVTGHVLGRDMANAAL